MFMTASSESLVDDLIIAEEQYQKDCARLSLKYPNLKHRTSGCSPVRCSEKSCRLACIEFDESGLPAGRILETVDDLREELANQSDCQVRRRLFVLEGLHESWETTLGAGLRIPHLLWMRHAKVDNLESISDQAGNVLPLATSAACSDTLLFEYAQLMRLNLELSKSSPRCLRCAENGRRIHTTKVNGKLDGVGAVRRKVSFWSRLVGSGGWDALIVVDRPFEHALARTDFQPVPRRSSQLAPTPFQGGYADFIPYDSLDDALKTEGPSRRSLLDDLWYYYTQHPQYLSLESGPHGLLTFPQKIIASEYALAVQYYQTLIGKLDLRLSRDEETTHVDRDWITRSWKDLMKLHWRLKDHRLAVQKIIQQLEWDRETDRTTSKHRSSAVDSLKWTDSLYDFHEIESQIAGLLERADSLTPAFTVISAEQSLMEARSVRSLTVPGVIFIPLSFVATIFSMSDAYRPGGHDHWMYWLVSVPLVLIVLLTALAIHGFRLRGLTKHISQSLRDYRLSGAAWFVRQRSTAAPGVESKV